MITDKNKNDSQFDSLYYAYYIPVFRYVYSQLKNKEEAEDIAQKVFIKVFEKNSLDNFENISQAYFFTIARNMTIDFYKKKKEIIVDPFDSDFASIKDINLDAHSEIEKSEIKDEIMRALDVLNFEQKEVLTLKFFADLGNDEISKIIGKSEEAIRQIQSRSIRKLQSILISL